jgi:lanthanide-dependent methanol dehydrogenase
MTVLITRSVCQFRTEDSTDPSWLSRWLRVLLTGASLALSPALALAQVPTVPATAAPPEDGQWTMPAKNYASTRYSALDEISGANVKNLQVAFAFSTGVDHGQEAAPIVANNTMYIVTPYPNILFALDLTKPGAPIKWSYRPHSVL